MKKPAGFTLIEVMIAVAVIGILSAIAIPNYSQYVLRSQLAEAKAKLSDMRAKLEQYYGNNVTYVGFNCARAPVGNEKFTISCPTQTAVAYTIQAVGAGSALGFTFTVNDLGTKATTTVPAGWTANATCWVSNKSGC